MIIAIAVTLTDGRTRMNATQAFEWTAEQVMLFVDKYGTTQGVPLILLTFVLVLGVAVAVYIWKGLGNENRDNGTSG